MCGDVDKLVETRELRSEPEFEAFIAKRLQEPACGEADGEQGLQLCSQFGNLPKLVFNHHRYSKNIATLMTAV